MDGNTLVDDESTVESKTVADEEIDVDKESDVDDENIRQIYRTSAEAFSDIGAREDQDSVSDSDCMTVDVTNERNADATAVAECIPSYANYGFKHIPVQVTGAWGAFKNSDNYSRGCKWSPDGSCILTCSNDNRFRIFDFPRELWQSDFDWDNVQEMKAAVTVPIGGLIYDYAWYPFMSSYDRGSCCFSSSSHGNPVHLWDAFTAELRATYRPYNHVDEIASPHSIAFDTSGQKLYCGFGKMIRIFDVDIPGRKFISRRTCEKQSGQSGIISCFAFSAVSEGISAAGSYSGTVGIYSEPDGTLEHLLAANRLGVTHMCFSPDGTKLFAGGRKDHEILCWDMRNLSHVLYSLRRSCLTSQRMYFDISRCGQYVVSGNSNGIVTVWDVTKEAKEVPNLDHPILEPEQFFQAHEDCVNGASFHPTMPIIATSSGQRKYPELLGSDEENESTEMFDYKSISFDNSLRLWWAQNTEQ